MSGKQFKPLLAYTVQDLFKIRFPVICSSKIDGIRCIVSEGKAVSRSLKPIPNKHIQQKLSEMSERFEGLTFESFGIKDLPRHPVFLGFRSDDDA